jgi:hypothetical protein
MSAMSGCVEVCLGRQGRLKERFAQVPVERALVDELIAERREQFSIEDGRREGM